MLWVRQADPASVMSADEIRELAAALEGCFERFAVLHPDARRDPAIARHRASMLARLALRCTDRRLAFSLFRRLIAVDPRAGPRLAPRVLLHLAFGETARRAWSRFAA